MDVKLSDLKETELALYNVLDREAKWRCNSGFHDRPMVRMCDNCGSFIANPFTDKKEALPVGGCSF